MKLMIASDLHGSAYYTHQLLDAWDREGAPRLFLLGDILYHGPRNDLPEGYAPKEVLAMLNERRDRIFCVRGNCDGEVDQMVLDFPIMADYAVLTEGERLIYATHGHVYNTAHLPPLQPGDILLHGHTHVPELVSGPDARPATLVLCPGAVFRSRGDFPRSIAKVEVEDGRVLSARIESLTGSTGVGWGQQPS